MDNRPEDELRQALREMGDELVRTAEQAEQLIRQAFDDARSLWTDPRRRDPADPAASTTTNTEESPVDAIRQLAALRNEGIITDEEFAAKKAELLGRI